jgi:hypothetical protein
MRVLFALSLLTMPALAQSLTPGTDQYWQQLTANRAAQCDTQLVQLMKILDDDKRQIADLEKQLQELKKQSHE